MKDKTTGRYMRPQIKSLKVSDLSGTIRTTSVARPSQEEIKKALEQATQVKKKQNNFLYE